jgi:hypothetical protein
MILISYSNQPDDSPLGLLTVLFHHLFINIFFNLFEISNSDQMTSIMLDKHDMN